MGSGVVGFRRPTSIWWCSTPYTLQQKPGTAWWQCTGSKNMRRSRPTNSGYKRWNNAPSFPSFFQPEELWAMKPPPFTGAWHQRFLNNGTSYTALPYVGYRAAWATPFFAHLCKESGTPKPLKNMQWGHLLPSTSSLPNHTTISNIQHLTRISLHIIIIQTSFKCTYLSYLLIYLFLFALLRTSSAKEKEKKKQVYTCTCTSTSTMCVHSARAQLYCYLLSTHSST